MRGWYAKCAGGPLVIIINGRAVQVSTQVPEISTGIAVFIVVITADSRANKTQVTDRVVNGIILEMNMNTSTCSSNIHVGPTDNATLSLSTLHLDWGSLQAYMVYIHFCIVTSLDL